MDLNRCCWVRLEREERKRRGEKNRFLIPTDAVSELNPYAASVSLSVSQPQASRASSSPTLALNRPSSRDLHLPPPLCHCYQSNPFGRLIPESMAAAAERSKRALKKRKEKKRRTPLHPLLLWRTEGLPSPLLLD